MTLNIGTNVIAPIVPNDSGDTYPSHIAEYGKGGMRTAMNLAERNAITAERRTEGMLVYVQSDQTLYQLGPDLSTWLALSATAPAVAAILAGAGISTSDSTGIVTITNSGVRSATAGAGIILSGATGDVVISASGSGVSSITAGAGISASASTGPVTLTNTGVRSAIAGTGVSVSGATGTVTFGNTGILGITGSGAGVNVTAGQNPVVTNTGVTSIVAGTNVTVSGATGAVTVNAPIPATVVQRNVANSYSKAQAVAPVRIPVSGVVNLSPTDSNYYILSIVGNVSSLDFSGGVQDGTVMNIKLVNSSGFTMPSSFPASWKFPGATGPVWSIPGTDFLSLIYDGVANTWAVSFLKGLA